MRIRDRLCQREERVYWRSLMEVLGGGLNLGWASHLCCTITLLYYTMMYSVHCTVYIHYTTQQFFTLLHSVSELSILVCVHWLNYALYCSAVKGAVLCSVVSVSVVSSIVYSAVQCSCSCAENTLQLLLLLHLLLLHLLLLRHKLGWSCSNLVIVDPRRDEQNFSSLLPHLQSQGGVRQKICRKAFGVFTSKVCNS